MRKVEVFKWAKDRTKIFDYIGTFHAFGVEYVEYENGPGNYSTCIIEKEDGSLANEPVNMVRFLPEEESNGE